jgi:YD repeat-containing protein
MVAIFTGLGAGAERGSANVLGGTGLLGSGTIGRSGEQVLLNAASGNLLIQQKDEMLVGRGPDAIVGRTYNSLGDLSDENGDNWRMSTDRRVSGLTGTVNTTGSTVKRTSADGSEITYTWNASASAYVATDGSGAYDKLTWTAAASTWTWTDGDSQATETYGYTATTGRYLISKATDTSGNALTYAYLTGGKLSKVTTADGGYTQYTWSGNNITQITTGYTDLPTGTAKTLTRTRYGYDSSSRLTTVTVDLSPGDNSVTDGKTYVTTYGYDGTSKRVASISQTDGSSLAITYDTSGRVKTMVQTAATGVTRTTTLDYQTGYTSVTDPAGQVTRLDYDGTGQLTKITAPAASSGAAQQVTQFSYTTNGDLASVIDPAGSTSSYANFTAFGAAQTITDRLGNVTTRTFGTKNELVTETTTGADQSGAAIQHTTRYVYDANDRVRFEISADGNVVEHRYDDTKGGVETVTLAYTGQFYSLSGLTATQIPTLSQMMDWAAATDLTTVSQRTYEFDARGNVIGSYGYTTTDSSGDGTAQGTFYIYDQAGQLLSTNTYQHAAQTYVYDGLGRVVSSVNLEGGTTSIVFNDAATSTVVTLAGGLVQTSTYNKAGELVSFAESGANTTVGTASYKYDALGRMRMATDATGHNSYVVYDKAGRKVADVDHYGVLTEYKYDSDDRIVATVTYATSVTATQLTTLANPLASIDLSSLRPAANGKDMWAWKVYDKEGRVLETIDGTGHAVQYEYDASGRPVRTTTYFNPLTTAKLSGFKTTSPATLTLPSVNTAHDSVSRIFYDKSGRVVGTLDGEGYLTKIDYDAAGRKVAETAFSSATVVANRTSGTFASLTTGLANATADRTTRYVYDGQGLLVFTIDPLNHVTEAVYPTADAADVNGMARQTIRYSGAIASPAAWTVAGVRAALNTAGVAGSASNRSDWSVYDNRNNLTYTVDATGAVTGYKYDASGNVTKVTRFATTRATATLPDSAAMDTWAANNGNAANDRITRNYYDARNELRYTVDGEGYVTRNDYDAEGRGVGTVGWFNAVAVTDTTTIAQVAALATGSTITTATTYDMDGRVASTVDGTGVTTSYVYDAPGGMLGKTYRAYGGADQVLTQYTYDAAGRVLSRTEAAGSSDSATTSFTYDGLGDLQTTNDPNGNTVTRTYDRAGRQLTSTDQEGLTTSYQYDAFDDLIATIDPRGAASYSYYDALGRATMTRDADDRVTGVAYNVFGEVAAVTRYANKATNAANSASLPAVTADPARDATVSYAYDKVGRVVTNTDAEAPATSQTYNAFGEVATRNDPMDSRTIRSSFGYDRRGLLRTQVVDAATGGKALTTTFGYDAFGRQVTLTDGNRAVTNKTYDNDGRLLSSKDALNNTTAYAYDKRGNLAAVTDALGNVTRYAYDKLDRQVYAVDALGNVTQTSYDRTGNATRSIAYAAPISLTGLATVTTASAIAGRVAADDANDRSTRSVYDRDGRLRYSLDAAGDLTEFLYDPAGNVIRSIAYAAPVVDVTDYSVGGMQAATAAMTAEQIAASATTRTVYDPAGQRTYGIDALGFVTAYAYDTRGNVVAQQRFATSYAGTDDPSDAAMASWAAGHATSADRLSRAVYDRDGRLRFDVDAENYVTQYVYDAASHLTQTIRYADRYPAFSGSTTIAQATTLVGATPPATSQVTTYAYDSAGRLDSKVADPGSGKLNITTSYSYDANSNVVAVTDGLNHVTRYAYDALNRRIASVDAEGAVTRTSYDALGQVIAITQYATRIPQATLDGYPKAITAGQAQVATAAGDRVTRTLYDADGRQVYTVDGAGYVTERRYDSAGNVTSMIRYADNVSVSDNVTRASLAALLPSSIPATAIVTGYVYDTANRLTQRVDDQGVNRLNVTTSYTYDTDGNVVATTDTLGHVTRFAYDKLDHQVWSVNAAGYASETRYDAFGGARTMIDYANRVVDAPTLAAWPLEVDAGRIAAGVSASGDDRTTRSLYDKDGRAVYAIDGEGFVTETRYDAVGNVAATIRYSTAIAATDAMATADVAALLPASIPADAAVTSYAYDRANRLTDTTDATGSVTHFDMDAVGDIVGTTVAYGTTQAATTSRSFDRVGRMTHETRAAGSTGQSGTDYGYDVFGDVVTVTGATTSAARRTYDALGRLVSDSTPVGGSTGTDLLTSKVYDGFGRVVQATDPNGNVGYFHYDNLDRLTVQVDPEGYVTQTTYTATGQKESVTRYANRATAVGDGKAMPAIASSSRDAITTFAYDKLDRLVATSDAQGYTERYALNAFGDRVAVTNKLGGVTFNAFDHRGQLVRETTQVRWTDPAQNLPMGSNITNTYAYDARGNLKTKIEAFGRPEARTTQYGYDKLDRLASTVHDAVDVLDPTTGAIAHVSPTERSSYDLRGNLIESVDATGARTLYYYDGQDRKVAEVNALGSLTTWQYDVNGNALYQRVYGDSVPLPATAGGTPPSPVSPTNVRETAYSYDGNNRRIATTIASVTVGRFDGSAYQTTQGVTTGQVYDGLGNVVRETDGNGAATFHYFDKLGREVAKVDAEGYLTTWQRDAEGNVTLERRYANRVTGGFDQSTAVATLVANTTADAANDRVTAFTYNRNGQRTQEVRFGVTGLMSGATGAQIGTTDAVIRYTYNALGEVLAKHEATGETTNYTYDDSGRLIRQQDAAIATLGNLRHTTDFAYDGLNDVVRTRESAAANTSAPDVLDDSLIPPPPLPVPLPVTATTIGYGSVDGNGAITGTTGNDLIAIPLDGYANFVDLYGGDGDDRLLNGSWSGGLYGGAGNDVLDFRANDQLGTGGAGSDFFVFDMGNIGEDTWALDPQYVWATVTDFTKGVDKIAILNSARSFSDLTLTQKGSDVEITMLHAPKIVVRNMQVASLTASDFVISRGTNTPTRQPSNVVFSPITTTELSAGGDKEDGTSANDALYMGTPENGGADGSLLFGHEGDDHLITETWNSQINGGDGNDVLEIRNDEIIAIGGSGNDTFVFDISKFKGDDWARIPDYVWANVVGFTSGRDRIVIPGRSYGDLTIAQVGTNVEISMPDAPRIILENMNVADLAPSDFLFPTDDATTPAPLPSDAPTTTSVVPGANDRVTSFTYGAGGRLISQMDASGFAHDFAYDAAGRVVRDSYARKRSDGTSVTEAQFTRYDALGRVAGQYAAALAGGSWVGGDVVGTTYNAYGDAVAKTVNGQAQEISDFDALGRVVKSNSGDGVWREYGYDGNGNVTLTVASNGYATNGSTVGDLLSRGLSGAADAVVTYNTYDKRNQATASYQPRRELGPQANGVAATQMLAKHQVVSAFGEIVSDTDVSGATTDYRYNTLGKVVERDGPVVAVTDEHGTTVTQRPTERYFYDASGRTVGMADANGRLTYRSLLEGTGYGKDEDALVTVEHRPDSTTATTEYDVFGDALAQIDGLNRRTQQSFDKMGRVVSVTHPGATSAQLIDTYSYDGLGQRITHSNSVYQVPGAGQSYPYYDAQAGGTFYQSTSGLYLVLGDSGGKNGTNGGATMPVSYPAKGPNGGTWSYDSAHRYAVLTPAAPATPDGTSTQAVAQPTQPGGGAGGTAVASPSPGVETTDYDAQGRVISTVNFAGDLTSYGYSWNSSLNAGLGTSGGWNRTTSAVADRASASDGVHAATDATDYFGRTVGRTDLGGNVYSYAYSQAGQLTLDVENLASGATRTVTNSYYNTGMLAQTVDSDPQIATYGYDAAGNRVYERLVTTAGQIKQDGRAEYDVLGRMTSYRDVAADGGADNVHLSWSYDAVGNIRSLTQSFRPMDPTGLSAQATANQTVWYAYDTMDRVVISQGSLVNGTIVRGWGVEMTYDAAGQRKTATTSTGVTAPGNAAAGSGTADASAHREIYSYSDDGQLTAVTQADAGANGLFGQTKALASYTRDAMGRVLAENDYDAQGNLAHSRSSIVYDNRDQVLSESDTQRQGTEVYYSYQSNWYGADGMLASTATQTWKQSGGSTTNATTTYQYIWRDSAQTSQATLTNTDGTTHSNYTYDIVNRLVKVDLPDGVRPRSVLLTTDLNGQILTRDEVPSGSNPPALNPHAKSYFFNGVEMGTVNNDGTSNTTFAAAVAAGEVAPPTTNPGPFRGGATYGSSYANFDRQHDAVNPSNVEPTAGSYTVHDGDTLASIAQATWGDANLWYLIAGANGLSGGETLAAGATLIIPNKVVNRANTSDTFRPYDPNDALGDVQPNTPTPKPQAKKKNKCGVFGAILLAVVAIAVTVVTAGAAAAALAPAAASAAGGGILGGLSVIAGGTALAGGLSAGALIGIGAGSAAVGSIVSQGVGVATGLQDQFSWKGVALSAIAGGVGAGLGGSGAFNGIQSGVIRAGVGGIAGNVATQGIGLATGLQRQFSWTAVAAAGVGAVVGYEAGQLFGAKPYVDTQTPKGVVLGDTSFGNHLAHLGQSSAALVANAGTRSLIDGSDFGDNITAALPDVLAQTIGDLITYGVKGRSGSADAGMPVAIPAAKRDELGKLGIPTTVGRDGSVTTDLSPAEITQRVAAAKAAGVNVEIGYDDDIVVGISRSASQKVENAAGEISYINYLADPGLSATYKSMFVGSMQTGATRFITNSQGETYLYDGTQTRIDGLGLSISYGTTVQSNVPNQQSYGYDLSSFQQALPSIASIVDGSRYGDHSYSWGGKDYVSQEAAMRDGATFISAPRISNRQIYDDAPAPYQVQLGITAGGAAIAPTVGGSLQASAVLNIPDTRQAGDFGIVFNGQAAGGIGGGAFAGVGAGLQGAASGPASQTLLSFGSSRYVEGDIGAYGIDGSASANFGKDGVESAGVGRGLFGPGLGLGSFVGQQGTVTVTITPNTIVNVFRGKVIMTSSGGK